MGFDRRSFVAISMCDLAVLAGPLRRAIAEQARKTQTKSILVIFEHGGISQTETRDPKPDDNTMHRGPFKTISSNVPGKQFT